MAAPGIGPGLRSDVAWTGSIVISAGTRGRAALPVVERGPVGVVTGLVSDVATGGVEFGVAQRERAVPLLPPEPIDADLAVHEGGRARFEFAREARHIDIGLQPDERVDVLLHATDGHGTQPRATQRPAIIPCSRGATSMVIHGSRPFVAQTR